MADTAPLGIDYGDVDLRAAVVADGRPVSFLVPNERATPALLFDPSANISSIGVGFPSLLQSVGDRRQLTAYDRVDTIDGLIQRQFVTLASMAREAARKPPGPVTVAVPSSMRQSRRQAVLSHARSAGLGDAALIDRCTAAALGFQADRPLSATALVFDLDYGGCEHSLVRMARGKCRVLATGASPSASGQAFDAVVMEELVLALRRKQIFLGLKQFTAYQWLDFRRIAEAARADLEAGRAFEVTLPVALTRLDEPLRLRLDAAGFAERLRPALDAVVDSVHATLEHAKLEPADVELFLLVGDASRTPLVSGRFRDTFGERVREADPGVVVAGAVWHSAQTPLSPVDPDPSPSAEAATGGNGPPNAPPPGRVAGFAEVISPTDRPAAPAPAVEPAPPSSDVAGLAALLRRMLDDGRRDEAARLLDEVERLSEQFRAELRRAPSSGPRLLLQRAQALFNAGAMNEAVALTHQAYGQASDDPEVFTQMMKIHSDVGLALRSPEEYPDAERILMCAYRHDQTDRGIHKALAERHYLHAAAMRASNQPGRARDAANKALSFDPKHPGANALLDELRSAETTPEADGEGGAP